jgi:hypothetical protein
MAYNQAPLKNIGNIRNKIAKRKLEKKFGSVDNAKSFAAEQFKSREEERRLSKKEVTPTETSFKTSIKPFEEETIKFNAPEVEVIKPKSKSKSKPKGKLTEITGKVAKEAGAKALDIVAPLAPGLGKRRTFVSGERNPNATWVLGSGSAFNEVVDQPTNPRTGGKRFRFGEWQRYKKDFYTPQERRYNIGANIRNKGFGAIGAAIVGHGKMQKKHGGSEQRFKLKDYKPFIGKTLKKGIKTFRSLI